MGFTREKFLKLSKDNKIKKVIFAVKDLIENKKESTYTETLIKWLNESEETKFYLPHTLYERGILLETLMQLIKEENSFIEEICYDDTNKEKKIFQIKLILNDIRSPFNVGSIIRTSEAFGVEEIIMSGITPTPENNSKVLKTSKSSNVPYTYSEDIIETILKIKEKKYSVISLEKTSNSIDINTTKIDFPMVLILGNEEFGVKKEILDLSDKIVHINMFGYKNSINVSVATGIALNKIVNGKLEI